MSEKKDSNLSDESLVWDINIRRKPEGSSEDLEWKEIKRETLIHDEWIDLRKSAYRFPDGTVFEPFYSYSRRDYVVIVATDEDGNYICVRQFRQGIKEVTTEFPAGGIERKNGKEYAGRAKLDPAGSGASSGATGSSSDGASDGGSTGAPEDGVTDDATEDILEAAKRELLEETGYESDDWEHLLTIPSNATISDNYAYIYAARKCRKVQDQDLDVTEFLNVCLHTEDEIKRLVYGGDFRQSVHVMAWLLAKEKHAE